MPTAPVGKERYHQPSTDRQIAMQDPNEQARGFVAQGFEALKGGRIGEAEALARRALGAEPSRPDAHFLVGLLALEKKDWRTAIAAFGSVTRLNPADRGALAHLAQLFQRVGHFERADEALAQALAGGDADPETADLIGLVLTQFGRHLEAGDWHRKAYAAAPLRADFAINHATASMFLGREAEAAAALDPFIEAEGLPQAEWLFSTLRRARGRTRADRLMARAQGAANAQAKAFYAYAAGKEFEDGALWHEAFTAFDVGARAKRSVTSFDENAEIALFEQLPCVFDAAWAARAGEGDADPAPFFIIGQPRTGTTLVERILASHSMVEAAGELQQFGLSVRRLARQGVETGATGIAAWASVDPRALGARYLSAVKPMRGARPRFIDKLPRNFLHTPLIAKSLPNARIVHLTRDPMDACFASYKQLFAEAYPHSYDQEEMARHYCRYARLMDHWRKVLPGAFLDVSYERLVTDLEGETRRLLGYLGLPFEAACLRFQDLDAPVATASAVQVREAVHQRSVGRWRRNEADLAPMRRILSAEGHTLAVVAQKER